MFSFVLLVHFCGYLLIGHEKAQKAQETLPKEQEGSVGS